MSIEKFLIDRNIARNKKQAEGIMIAAIVLCLLFIVIRSFGGGNDDNSITDPDPIELEQLESPVS